MTPNDDTSAFAQLRATFRRNPTTTNDARNHESLFDLYYDI